MNAGRVLFLIFGTALAFLGAVKVFLAFNRLNAGPELIADATVCALGAIVCFWLGAKLSKRKADGP